AQSRREEGRRLHHQYLRSGRQQREAGREVGANLVFALSDNVSDNTMRAITRIAPTDMDTAVKVPLSERINLRMIVFIGVIGFLVGYPIYVLIDAQVSGGVKNAANGYKLVDLKAMSTFEFD